MMRGLYRRKLKLDFRFNFNLKRFNWGKVFLGLLVGGFIFASGVFLYFTRDLPDPTKIVRRSGYSSIVLDRTGKVNLYDIYTDENRKFTPLSEIPEYLKKATIAVEDKDFYKHGGFDPMGFLRIIKNVVVNRRLIGGSTLTQQLVKNVLLTNERTISRKIKEFVLSIRIEKQFTKDDILQMYLNEAPYGGTSWGVSAAAQQYFGKDVKDLNLTESIILAGIPQAPSRYSPQSSNPKAYVTRAKEVARRMKEDNYIDGTLEKQVDDALPNVEFLKPNQKIKAPHFVMFVKQQIEEMLGGGILDSGGLRVTTTLDYPLQAAAEKIVFEEIDKVKTNLKISNGASVVVNPNNGEILSMVGSRGFFDKEIDGQVNVVTRLRQPGSSIKPLVYATAFEKGFSPATMLMDVVTEFPGKDDKTPYSPRDYDGLERGPVKLRESLGSSLNVPAVKLLALVGVRDVLEQANKMGLSSLAPSQDNLTRLGLSLALGGGEIRLLDLVSAYGSFANGGLKVEPIGILKIEDKNGRVIFEKKQVKPERVIDEKVTFLINSILSDNNARLLTFGPNSYLNLGSRAIAVKTGTTNDLRDNWTIGWSRDGVVGVWVGNNDNSQMKNVASGVSGAAPIWRREMLEVLSKMPDRPFETPKGVSQVEVDKISGYPAHDGFESYKEWFIDGTVPTSDDPYHLKIKVCKNQNEKLANQVQIGQGNYDLKEVLMAKEKDPLTDKDFWQKAIDGWIATKSADLRFKVPTEYCEISSGVDVKILTPGGNARVDGNAVEIKYEVYSDANIEWVDLYLDDVKEERFNNSSSGKKTYNLINGNHKLRIVARNSKGTESDRIINFGVNQDYTTPTASPSGSI